MPCCYQGRRAAGSVCPGSCFITVWVLPRRCGSNLSIADSPVRELARSVASFSLCPGLTPSRPRTAQWVNRTSPSASPRLGLEPRFYPPLVNVKAERGLSKMFEGLRLLYTQVGKRFPSQLQVPRGEGPQKQGHMGTCWGYLPSRPPRALLRGSPCQLSPGAPKQGFRGLPHTVKQLPR